MDTLLQKAREFTDIEDQTLAAWLVAANAGLNDLAAKVLDAGLMAEHYRSLIDPVPTLEQKATFDGLVAMFRGVSGEVGDALNALEAAKQAQSPLTNSAPPAEGPYPGGQS